MVEGSLAWRPVAGDVPLGFTFYLLVKVEHLLGLQSLLIEASVPTAVVVAVDDETGIIFALLEVEKLCCAVACHGCLLYGLVVAVEQLHEAGCAVHAADVEEQRAVGIERWHLEALLYRGRLKAVDVGKGCRVDLQAVFNVRPPLADQLKLALHLQAVPVGCCRCPIAGRCCRVAFQLLVLQRSEEEARVIPQRVVLGVEMNFRCVHPCQRHAKRELYVAVGVKVGRGFQLHVYLFSREHRVVTFAALLQLGLLLLPVVHLLLEVFHASLIGLLRQQFERVGLAHDVSERVGHVVSKLNVERVAVNEGCVSEPVGYGVETCRRLHHEGVLLVKVEASDHGQLLVAMAEEELEVVGLLTLLLHKIAVGHLLVEGSEHDVVGQEMAIFDLLYVFYSQRVAPQRVLPHVIDDVWLDGVG